MMVVKDARGVYESHSPGLAIFTGVGNPLCLTVSTPCKIHSILLKLNIAVE
jgi:hypothetical protein